MYVFMAISFLFVFSTGLSRKGIALEESRDGKRTE
jgi:hypothetical protein